MATTIPDLKAQKLSRDLVVSAYRTMYLSRRIDDKEIQLKRQNRAFFQIGGVGHEAINVACALHLKPGYDWFFPYYRDRAFCLQLGMTPLDMFLGSVGAEDDPCSGGRQMPSHWSSKPLHIVSQSSPTGTQILHAVGAAEASWYFAQVQEAAELAPSFHADEVAYVSLGDGASSEGEFWESLNWASNRKLPVFYVVEDNAYAISVPVDVQTAGGNISRLLGNFPNLLVLECDGTDFLASYDAAASTCASDKGRRSFTRTSSGRTRTHFPTTNGSTNPTKCARRRPSATLWPAWPATLSPSAWLRRKN